VLTVRSIVFFGLALAISILSPSTAAAQWYVQGYFGGNHTRSADVHIRQPAASVDLTYRNVSFVGRPLETPPYYGYRVGRWFRGGRFGAEFEFLHLKVYAVTDAVVPVSGQAGGISVAGAQTMSSTVERYSMSHGLNFMLVNVVSRMPFGGRGSAFVVRGGLGPTLPHGESVVFGVSQEQYEWAGLGAQTAAGLDVHVAGRLSATFEYKLSYARPTISIAGGTGQMSALTQQGIVGFGVALGRRP
jgi:lipid A oxidase